MADGAHEEEEVAEASLRSGFGDLGWDVELAPEGPQPPPEAGGATRATGSTLLMQKCITGGSDTSLPMQLPVTKLSRRTLDGIIFSNIAFLRATRSFHVMRGFGRLFKNSEGSAATYALSEPVTGIDAFISHNWSSTVTEKYLALCMHFNLGTAVLAVAFAVALAILLTVLEILPTFTIHPLLSAGRSPQISISCRVAGAIVFPLTMLLGHEITGRLGCTGHWLFVDKTVIHQTDMELKREGIQHLAAFLAHSDRMVILYNSETYLKRLWTVYELASMLFLKPIHCIVFIPTLLAKLTLPTTSLWLLCTILRSILQSEPMYGLWGGLWGCGGHLGRATTYVPFALPIIILATWHRYWAFDCMQIQNSVEYFSIQNALCTREEDRPLVVGNIAAFMRDLGLVEAKASEAEASEAFDAFVRTTLPAALAPYMRGRMYKFICIFFLGNVLEAGDEISAGYLDGRVRQACIWTTYNALMGLAVLPSVVATMMWAGKEIGRMKCVMKYLLCSAIWFPVVRFLDRVGQRSVTSDSFLVAYLGMGVAIVAITSWLFRSPDAAHMPHMQRLQRLQSSVVRQATAAHQAREAVAAPSAE